MTKAALGLLLTLLASFMLLVIMPPIEVIGWVKDRLQGRIPPAERDGVELEEL